MTRVIFLSVITQVNLIKLCVLSVKTIYITTSPYNKFYYPILIVPFNLIIHRHEL